HGLLPRTLHADAPTDQVDWSTGAARLLAEPAPWPDGAGPRRAGVSAFGMSGTNAHAIIEQAPAIPPASTSTASTSTVDGPTAWLLSARDEDALRAQARRLLDHVTKRDLDPADVGHSLVTTRTAFEHRAVVVGTSREELSAPLAALGRGRPHPDLERGKAAAP